MSFRYAGFWTRAIAESIDIAILIVASTLLDLLGLGALYAVRVVTGGLKLRFVDAFDPSLLQLSMLAAYVLLAFVYFTIAHRRPGATLGQRIFGLRVVNADGSSPISWMRSLGRTAASVFSALPLGAGYWLALLHPEKRTLHDMVAGTVVLAGVSKPTPE